MVLKILAHPGSYPSAITLKNALRQLSNGKRILVTSHPNRILRNRPVLRYGNSSRTNGRETGYNPPEFINFSSNKIIFCRELSNAGIFAPEFSRNSRPQQFPVIIRSIIQGNGGRGIFVAEDIQEFRNLWHRGFWWTPFYRTEFEIRAHVFLPENGGVIVPRIFRKVGEDERFPIRTNDDYHFQLKDVRRYKRATDVIEMMEPILRRHGAKFLALDMAWDSRNKRYIVFESNSAPGLNDNTAIEYARFLIDDGLQV